MMNTDINFFAPYLGKKKEKKNKGIYIYTTIGVLTIIIFGTFTINTVKTIKLKREITNIKAELENPSLQDQVNESEVVNKKLQILEKYDTSITALTQGIATRDLISTQLLNNISSTIPEGVSFKNINITSGSLSISASAKTRTEIAEVQHNLKELPEILDVYIGAISGTGENGTEFSFDLKCTLKGVN